MSKYIIDVGEAYVKHICGEGDMLCLPVRINEFDDNWLNTNIPLTPYTEPDTEKIRKEAYDKGFKDGTKKCINCEDFKENAKAEAYQKGLSDAWEAARKICLPEPDGGISTDDICKIFNVSYYTLALKVCSASEAIEKIRQYEQKQEEQIQVGDEVEFYNGEKSVVLVVEDGKPVKLLEADGYTTTADGDLLSSMKKTGRTFPEIAEVLAKMKEES